jgi:hypothetical protein
VRPGAQVDQQDLVTIMEGESTVESSLLSDTDRLRFSASMGEGSATDTEGSRAWGLLWAVTEIALRLLTNGRWGAPPAVWLASMYCLSLARIRDMLEMLGAVLSPNAYDLVWARCERSVFLGCGAEQSGIDEVTSARQERSARMPKLRHSRWGGNATAT